MLEKFKNLFKKKPKEEQIVYTYKDKIVTTYKPSKEIEEQNKENGIDIQAEIRNAVIQEFRYEVMIDILKTKGITDFDFIQHLYISIMDVNEHTISDKNS